MNRTDMANLLAAEMLEDLAELERHMLAFGERWRRYGEQFKSEVPAETLDRIEAAFKSFVSKMEAFGE